MKSEQESSYKSRRQNCHGSMLNALVATSKGNVCTLPAELKFRLQVADSIATLVHIVLLSYHNRQGSGAYS